MGAHQITKWVGAFACALAYTAAAHGKTAVTQIAVSARVESTCRIGAPYLPINPNDAASTNLWIQCANDTPYSVTLSGDGHSFQFSNHIVGTRYTIANGFQQPLGVRAIGQVIGGPATVAIYY